MRWNCDNEIMKAYKKYMIRNVQDESPALFFVDVAFAFDLEVNNLGIVRLLIEFCSNSI